MSSSPSITRNAFVNSICTFASRIFGLVRDIMLGWYWGCTEAPQAAFNIAFAIPNMLRMLFGEGAFNAAFVPMIAVKLKEGKKEDAELLASRTLTLQCLLLGSIVLLGSVASLLVHHSLTPERPEHVRLLFSILPILLPYAIFICMTGAFGAILNCLGQFAAPSLNPILFNLIQIATIAFLWLFGKTRQEFSSLILFCLGVFLSGLLQAAVLAWRCIKKGFKIRLVPPWQHSPTGNAIPIWRHDDVRTLCKRILPGLLGAGVFQINALLDKVFASCLGAAAIGSLAYSQHLVYLPVGIFGVAMGVACLPQMARSTESEKGACLDSALRQVLFMTLPCTALLGVLATPVITLLFQRGAFTDEAVRETAWAMRFLLPGLPAFCAVKVAVTTYHGRMDTQTPVRISMYCVLLNVILNATLIHFLRQGGLALSTAICSWTNLLTLLCLDARHLTNWNWRHTLGSFLKMTVAAALGALATYGISMAIHTRQAPSDSQLGNALLHLSAGLAGLITYLICCALFRLSEIRDLLHALKKKVSN